MLGSIAAHYQNAIAVFNVDPVIGHCAASERLSQSRYRGAVSGTGLVVDMDDAQAARHLGGRRALFVVGM